MDVDDAHWADVLESKVAHAIRDDCDVQVTSFGEVSHASIPQVCIIKLERRAPYLGGQFWSVGPRRSVAPADREAELAAFRRLCRVRREGPGAEQGLHMGKTVIGANTSAENVGMLRGRPHCYYRPAIPCPCSIKG